jgi:hypothetical protein
MRIVRAAFHDLNTRPYRIVDLMMRLLNLTPSVPAAFIILCPMLLLPRALRSSHDLITARILSAESMHFILSSGTSLSGGFLYRWNSESCSASKNPCFGGPHVSQKYSQSFFFNWAGRQFPLVDMALYHCIFGDSVRVLNLPRLKPLRLFLNYIGYFTCGLRFEPFDDPCTVIS